MEQNAAEPVGRIDREAAADAEDDRRQRRPEVPIPQADGDRFFPVNRVAAKNLDVDVKLPGVDQAEDREQAHDRPEAGPAPHQKRIVSVVHNAESAARGVNEQRRPASGSLGRPPAEPP